MITPPRAASSVAMEVGCVDILEVSLPFRIAFSHSLATRKSSTNILVRARLRDGTVGYGEAVPRSYVTGETAEDVVRKIEEALAAPWWRRGFDSIAAVAEALEARYAAEGPEQGRAARCALELAFLDAAGKRFGKSCAELLGKVRNPQVEYTAVLPFVRNPVVLFALCLRVRRLGMRTIKVKVGQGPRHDLRALALARWALGREGSVRVDANAGWTADQAAEALAPMIERGLDGIEQPVAASDLAGMAHLAELLEPPVIADESFCTLADARRLLEHRAADVLNLRLSKCGGLLTSRRILMEAGDRGVLCQLGAQVGESGILTAAGRLFACAFPELLFREGAAGRFLLEEDLTVEDTTFGRGGLAPALTGPGLGVTVDEERLAHRAQLLRTIC